jgi:hypothetical protein
MASIRNLKKDINYLTDELLAECLTYAYFHKEVVAEKINKAATDIISNRNELIKRINHIDDADSPKAVKAHFNKIRHDFGISIESLDNIENAKK